MGNAPHKLFQEISGPESPDMPLSIETPHYKIVQKPKTDMTSWERIMHVFSTDEYGEPTPELLRCKDATMLAFVVGAIYGGVGRSRVAYMEFF